MSQKTLPFLLCLKPNRPTPDLRIGDVKGKKKVKKKKVKKRNTLNLIMIANRYKEKTSSNVYDLLMMQIILHLSEQEIFFFFFWKFSTMLDTLTTQLSSFSILVFSLSDHES